jgi:uncharacterized OsmC-like protein/fermentation-respiration switch protein FrsA (DUF1100 family)
MTFSNSAASIVRATFTGSAGVDLSARLDLPAGRVRAFALFAHCFTCSKDLLAVRRIAGELANSGIGVLRFDFTGLGSSEGEFANTHFSSNVQDIITAASYLRDNFAAPAILIGHSLGGAAVLAAAADVPEAKAVVTIGAPADVSHVLGQFGSSLQEIRDKGEAQVTLAGRSFNVSRAFVEDALGHRLTDRVSKLGKALLVMHAPRDAVVGIDNASRIFLAAKHPKSFVSLDDADHLLSDPDSATYAARVIGAWASKYVPDAPFEPADETVGVLVRETGQGTYQNAIVAGRHRLIADEPVAAGGLDSGPTPYDYLAIALGACTAMTLRIYAKHKKLALGRVSVTVRHGKVVAQHCSDCGAVVEGREGRIDRFERIIAVEGEVDAALRDKLIEIADKCPVHRTLEVASAVVTTVVPSAATEQPRAQGGRE